jgi:hypothetical protein
MVEQMIEKLERIAANERYPQNVRDAARCDADGFRAALAAKRDSATVTVTLTWSAFDVPEGVDVAAWTVQLLADALDDAGRVTPKEWNAWAVEG